MKYGEKVNQTRNCAGFTSNPGLLLAAFLLVNSTVICFAADTLTSITLQHRQADELIPVIKELLSPGDGISGMGDQLIIRADAGKLAAIRRLVADLDRPPKQFLISLQFDNSHGTRSHHGSVSGEGRIIQDNGQSRQQLQVQTRIHNNHSQGGNSATRKIQVMEGSPARIHTGRESGGVTGGNAAAEGLSVIARMTGNKVKLAITPFKTTGIGGKQEAFSAETVIIVNPGVWTELGSISTLASHPSGGIMTRSYSTQNLHSRAMIKVDLVNQ